MYRTFSPSEEMVNISDLQMAVDTRSSNADAVNNLLEIVKQMKEVESFLSAARSYVHTSKTVLENLKRYLCIAEADILCAAECITGSEIRLQRMNLKLQSLFQNIFYQDLGHCNRHAPDKRTAHSTRTTSSVSEHVIDTIKRYAKNKSINLNTCTVTYEEYEGAKIVILQPNSIQSRNLLNLKRDSLGSNISYWRNILESSTSESANVVNGDYTTSNDSKSMQENFGGIAFNNPQWEASCEQQPDLFLALGQGGESLVREKTYSSKPTRTSCEMNQLENEDSSLPVKELRQLSFQTEACNICSNLPVSMNEASFNYRHSQGKCSSVINFPVKPNKDICDNHQVFPVGKNGKYFTQIGSERNVENLPSEDISDLPHNFLTGKNAEHFTGTSSKLNSANAPTFTTSPEFPECEKTDSNKIPGTQLDVTQSEGTPIGYSKNTDSFYPVKKCEMVNDVNGNTTLFETQIDENLAKASKNSDFICNKDNESGSGSAKHSSSSRETILTFPLQNRLSTNVSFQNTPETRSQTDEKATFCNRTAISLTYDSTEKPVVANKVRMGKCDRTNKADVFTYERFSPDMTLKAAKALNNESKSNTSENSTLNVASNISKTTVPSNSNFEYIDIKKRSDISCFNDNVLNSKNNTLQSFTIQDKSYLSSQKQVSNNRSFKFHKDIADVKKSDSKNSMGNQTFPEENTNTLRRANYWASGQEQLNSRTVSDGYNSRKSIKHFEYFSSKEINGQEDNENMLLADGHLDCSFSEIIASDNPSFKAESKYFDTSSELREPDYGSIHECASDMNYVNISSEISESERFQNVSSIATDHSRLSETPRSPVHPFDDNRFASFHSPREGI